MRMNVLIFCSSNKLEEKYTKPAKELARLLARAGHNMVYGGSDYGLMKDMADGMQAGGAKIVGITIPVYAEYSRKNADEMIIAKTLGERKATMLERSDVVITLVGGIGTLDELAELVELKKQAHHNKRLIVLNTDGFYDGLRMQLKRIADEKLLKIGENVELPTVTLDGLIQFVNEPAEVMQLLGTAESDKQPIMQVPTKN
jgi:uncharacterized protein (TIGR00730 family)